MLCRRYQCQQAGCGALIVVGPGEVVSRYRFFASAIALALFLWSSCEQPPGAVWARCTGHPKDRLDLPERWRSLTRWGRAALRGTLFPGISAPAMGAGMVHRAAVRSVIEQLLGRAPAASREESDAIRVMSGAMQLM